MKFRKTAIFVAAVLLMTQIFSTVAFAESGMTDGGTSGYLVITYNLSLSSRSAYATTTAPTYSPNPNVSTYVEARYWDPGSKTYRLSTASGSTSATANTPYDLQDARSTHTANSQAWGYFRATLIRP